MKRPLILLLALSTTLLSTTACKEAIEMAQLAMRVGSVARSIDSDGNSTDPAVRTLQAAAEEACRKGAACAKSQEDNEDEALAAQLEEIYGQIEGVCDNAKILAVFAHAGGKDCVKALTAQFQCYAATSCPPTDDDQARCKGFQDKAEASCTLPTLP